MAQLVERTLGKGEVPSSILGISTISLKRIASEILEAFFVSVPPFFFSNYSIQSTYSYLFILNYIILIFN